MKVVDRQKIDQNSYSVKKEENLIFVVLTKDVLSPRNYICLDIAKYRVLVFNFYHSYIGSHLVLK